MLCYHVTWAILPELGVFWLTMPWSPACTPALCNKIEPGPEGTGKLREKVDQMTLTSDTLFSLPQPVPKATWGVLYGQLPEGGKCRNYPQMDGYSTTTPLCPVDGTSGCLPSGSISLKEEMVGKYGFIAIHRLWPSFWPDGQRDIECGDICVLWECSTSGDLKTEGFQ